MIKSLLFVLLQTATCFAWSVRVVRQGSEPVLSAQNSGALGSSAFRQTFNPSYVESSMGVSPGILARVQNCTNGRANCPGTTSPSALAFAPLVADSFPPTFSSLVATSVVFSRTGEAEEDGVEDPRMLLVNGTYHLMYTAFGTVDGVKSPRLSHAITTTPTVAGSYRRLGAVFPGSLNSKSGALVPRLATQNTHYLLWGAGTITVATSPDMLTWTNRSTLLEPRADHFDSKLVESGPPPLPLSDGNLLFIYNSANETLAYNVGWVILNGTDPSQILQRSSVPLLTPSLGWERGTAPFLCNVPNVIFLEAAIALPERTDTFRVYYGGADDVIGVADLTVTM